ncbi:uncharacterized protein cubi_01409 [Cryptosporidium ubiquitum]|uniref:Uncharacterized protein n=1 Tax=Cryptosporidium ubiquitum TaxID=857276 RepID=A0A1J4MGC8_9CRYT|nr:uncharacterized protein cubi_01409 [Cryptosporidium ubiquitum]OII72076.1 hypothetical protein cubi_01409 [Cryptosporidium ubiquitum]
MYFVWLRFSLFLFIFSCINGIYSDLQNPEIFLIDVYRLDKNIVVSSIYNTSNPNEYITNMADPEGKYPIITNTPIDVPKLIDEDTVQILGKDYKIKEFQPLGLQKCLTPLYNLSSCQQICITGYSATFLSVFNSFALVYNTPNKHFQLNITNASELKVDGDNVQYAVINCSVSTLNTVMWGFLTFAVIFSFLVFALFTFEIVEYLRFKADMRDPLIIGGEIRTITSRDFSLESFSTK